MGRLGIKYDVFDKIRCEPSQKSMQEAIDFARSKPFDCFLAVGGGSVIDTCKVHIIFDKYL